MLFIATLKTPTSSYKAVMERFKTVGAPAPEGVELVGRWHWADGSGAVVICEASDAVALAKWTKEWADLISIECAPALTDEQMGSVLA